MNKKFYIGICLLFPALFGAMISTQAATLTVTTKTDSGAGSLRQAIIAANNDDKIVFAPGLSGSIFLTSRLSINKNLTINGPGANVLGVEGRSTPTEANVFQISAGTSLISDLRIAHGFSSGAGGGVVVGGGNLTLNNCLVIGNEAESAGGVFVGGGSSLTITNSTIDGNDSAVEGGGISNRGGTLTIINSTIIENESPLGGGISVDSGGTATILDCTITKNGRNGSTSGDVGGLRIVTGSTVNLKNSIIAGNIAVGSSFPDLGGIINSQGNNLVGNRTGGAGFVASDLPNNTNPQFGGFANNGGATYTVSLLSTSPAINAGNNTGAPATDQRGVARPQGAAVEIGSYESGAIPAAFGKIAFVRIVGTNREIFSMNADGSNQLNLTNNAARDDEPKWSPDGSKIVFVSDRDALLEIYSMNADGSALTRLTNNFVADENPVFSPDGTKIAFDRSGQIFTMNANGTGVSQVTGSAFSGIKTHPPWSPDGSMIVFQNNLGFGQFLIQVVAATCSNCNGQTFVPQMPSDNFNPIWSPDGNAIAFSNDQNPSGDQSQPSTFLFSPFLGSLSFPARPLSATNNPLMFSPAWSPDGTKLVYRANSSGDLFIINADGSNPTNLGLGGFNSLPDWFGFNTPTGANITALSGTVAATFSNVGTGGTTTAVPIDAATAGTLPNGYSFGTGFPAYEITTTASYTAPITVCLQVPGVTTLAVFNALTLFHSEGGVFVDRTSSRNFATKTICASVNSLSPFVVAQNLAPTAANVIISGRVSDANGNAVSRARVSITDQNGETRFVMTGSFGFYRFTEVPAGQTYVISAAHKRYQFNSQVISVSEDIQNADFTAEP
jgi:Carboxypeptidase regulatory-like domain/Right handed beta helix region/WD40-like Beta Propeller Repeat